MTQDYGAIILRNARTYRDTKSAGLDYIAADSNATERRGDRWILAMAVIAIPICLFQFLERF